MLNIEKYEKEILHNDIGEYLCTMRAIREGLQDMDDVQADCTCDCGKCLIKSIKWFSKQYSEPMLTDKEELIIKTMIKALKLLGYEVKYIGRYPWSEEEHDFYLSFQNENYGEIISPSLRNDKMFEKMELEKDYTLEELGLNDA